MVANYWMLIMKYFSSFVIMKQILSLEWDEILSLMTLKVAI